MIFNNPCFGDSQRQALDKRSKRLGKISTKNTRTNKGRKPPRTFPIKLYIYKRDIKKIELPLNPFRIQTTIKSHPHFINRFYEAIFYLNIRFILNYYK